MVLSSIVRSVAILLIAGLASAQTGSAPTFDYEELEKDGGPGSPSGCDDPALRIDQDMTASQATCGTCPGGQSPIETGETYNDTGDPVLLHNGAVSFRATDLKIPGRGINFELTRRYNSKRSTEDSVMGYGWEFAFDQRIFFSGHHASALDATVQNGNNRVNLYERGSTASAFLGKHGVYTRLYYDGTQWIIRGRHGSRSYFELDPARSGTVARLVRVEDASGNNLQIAYNSTGSYVGTVSSVTDSLGRVVTFTYATVSGFTRLDTVTDSAGRAVVYGFDSTGNLVSVRSPTVTSTGGINDFASGRTEKYTYVSGTHLLESIARPREVAANPTSPAAYVSFTYYDDSPSHTAWWDGWVSSQTLGSHAITYQYETGLTPSVSVGTTVIRTKVTDRRGNETRYWFNATGQVALKEEMDGTAAWQTQFAYNSDGEVTQIIRPRGNVETRTYQTGGTRFDDGNVVSITHSIGSVTSLDHPGYDSVTTNYVWDPVFNQLISRSDPRNSAWNTTFVLDYMEGNATASAVNDVAPAIASLLGESVSTVRTMLSSLGVMLNADVNGDGIGGTVGAVGVAGHVIMRSEPPVDLTQTPFGADNQAGVEGSGSQEAITTWTYNVYGQVTSQTDAEENVSLFAYTPKDDLDSDGVIDGGLGSPATTTGGYPRQTIEDTSFSFLGTYSGQFSGLVARGLASDIGRNQGPGSTPSITTRTTDVFYNRIGHVVAYVDARGVRHEVSVNELGEVWKVQRGIDTSAAATRQGGAPEETTEAHLSGAALGYVRILTRDANGMIVAVKDTDSVAGGAATWDTAYSYDLLNNLRYEYREKAHGTFVATETRYDENENVTDIVSELGNATRFVYDVRDQLIETYRGVDGGSLVLVEARTYDDNGNVDTRTGGMSDLTAYGYDEFDRIREVVDANGNIHVYTYDEASNVTQTLEKLKPVGSGAAAALRSANYTYDERSRVWRIDWKPEDGSTVTSGSLDTGDTGVNRRQEFDRLSRLNFVTEDDSEVREYQYDGLGRLVWTRDPLGNVRQGSFDDENNLVLVAATDKYPSTAPDRSFWTWRRYDALGRLSSFTNQLGETDRFSYDARDLLIATSDAEASGSGGTIHGVSVNPPGNTRSFEYDGRGLRTHEHMHLRAGGVGGGSLVDTVTTQQVWDDDDRLFQRVDDNGRVTEYVRDTRGRVLQEIFADSTEIVRTYDNNDRIDTQTDARGNVSDFGYDDLGNLESVALTSGSPGLSADGAHTLLFTLDGFGRRKATKVIYRSGSSAVETVEYSRTFDAFDRLLTETEIGTPSRTVASAWREEGKRTRLSYPTTATSQGQFELDYIYDELDRIAEIGRTINATTSPSRLVSAAYTYAGPDRKLSRSLRNRQSTRWYTGTFDDTLFYDGARRQIQLTHIDLVGPVTLGTFGNTYNRAGARKTESRSHDQRPTESVSHGDNYELDSLYRLVGFERRVPAADIGTLGLGNEEFLRQWDLDGAHNWTGVDTNGTPVSNAVDSVNSYTSFDGLIPTYDLDGNLLKPDGSGTIVLRYDFLNRLVGVENTASGHRLEHVYDAEGRRVRTNFFGGVAGSVTARVYVYDDWEVIEEHDEVSSALVFMRRYIMGVEVDEPISMEGLPGQTGMRTFHYMQSTLGNVVGLTDNACDVAERYTYDAYGAPRFEDGDNVPHTNQKSTYGNPYLFAGRRYEPWILPMYEYRNRFYLPSHGRFLQRDPIGIWGDIGNAGNATAYVGSRPLDWDDPFGLQGGAGAAAIPVGATAGLWIARGVGAVLVFVPGATVVGVGILLMTIPANVSITDQPTSGSGPGVSTGPSRPVPTPAPATPAPPPALRPEPPVVAGPQQNPFAPTNPLGLQAALGLLYMTLVCDGAIPIGLIRFADEAEHTKNKRPSTKQKHEDAEARRKADKGGEKKDERMPYKRGGK